MTTAEKEEEIKGLIRRTSSRVLPGIHWLPEDYYSSDDTANVPRNRRSRRRDKEGQLILDSDDEVVSVKPGHKPAADPKNVALPRKSAKVPDPQTDSESTSSGSTNGTQSGFVKPMAAAKRAKKVIVHCHLC